MKIRLITTHTPDTQPIRGAFIRGNHPGQWLPELDHWGIPLQELQAFIVPESLQNPAPAGLFVVFPASKSPHVTAILHPYQLLAGKLFVPLHTDLYPAVRETELRELLVWDWQMFHPTYGFMGFERADQLVWTDLFEALPPRSRSWEHACPGPLPLPSLHRIRMEQPPVDEIVESFRESVGSQSLEEIPQKRNKNPDETNSLFINIVLTILGFFALLLGWLMIPFGWLFRWLKLPDIPTSGSGGRGGGGALSRMMHNAINWLERKRENLDKERDSEVRRLLQLFEEDMNNALQYAIPLQSPYANRGTAPQSSQLSRQDTNFSLRGLRGGRQVDGWNLDKYYYDLRQKYLHAANTEVAAGNFRRAAYIHAKLLGDYRAAANVLEQGKFYREAAVLYKDHLKNPVAAAECYERGGLWQEAAELYLELQKHEKAADLYQQLTQHEKATQLYQRCVDDSLNRHDHLDAARLLTNKLHNVPLAQQTLLDGWAHSSKPEGCLEQYFASIAYTQADQLPLKIREVYTHHTSTTQQTPFLQILAAVQHKYPHPEVTGLTQDIAYEIISEQIAKGNTQNLSRLTTFVPDDRLIRADTHRFLNHYKPPVHTPQKQPSVSGLLQTLLLPENIHWVRFCTFREHTIGIGYTPSPSQEVHTFSVVQVSPQGEMRMHAWGKVPLVQGLGDTIHLVNDAVYGSNVLVCSSQRLILNNFTLESLTAEPTPLRLSMPGWLPQNLVGICLRPNNGLAIVYQDNDALTLSHYQLIDSSLDDNVIVRGRLVASHHCRSSQHSAFYTVPAAHPPTMCYHNGWHYLYSGSCMLRISEDGLTELLDLQAPVRGMTATGHFAALRLIVATDNGYFIVRPDAHTMHTTHRFEETTELVAMHYIPDNGLVIATAHKAVVYDIKEDRPTVRHQIETQAAIRHVLPGTQRHTCALITDDNRMHFYAIG